MATGITDTVTPLRPTRVEKRTSRDILINLALFILSIIFALLLCEVALRLMGYSPLYVSPERALFWQYDSLLGWSHRPGQEGTFETAQFRTFVHINQKGLRDSERSYERDTNAPRILVLGDSFVWGYGVDASERFSQLLEPMLHTEVINAGVSGYSTDQELLWYKNEGIKYDADLVILGFTGNDIGDNQRNLVSTIYYKPYFVQDGNTLVLNGSPVQKTNPQGQFIYSLSQHSALAFFLVQRYFDLRELYGRFRTTADTTGNGTATTAATGKSFGLTVALLHEIETLAASKGAKFMIVANDAWWNNPTTDTYQDFINTLQTEGFSVVDVESIAGFDPDAMVIPQDGHWNQAGHEFVAGQLSTFIESHRLLNPRQP